MAIGWEHTCAIKTDDTISCWGLNDQGQGNFPAGSYKAITAGFVHTCAIKSDDSIVCRGKNNKGQINGPSGSYVSLSAGSYHTCAITTDGAIACWGDRSNGKQIGPRAPIGVSPPKALIPAPSLPTTRFLAGARTPAVNPIRRRAHSSPWLYPRTTRVESRRKARSNVGVGT